MKFGVAVLIVVVVGIAGWLAIAIGTIGAWGALSGALGTSNSTGLGVTMVALAIAGFALVALSTILDVLVDIARALVATKDQQIQTVRTAPHERTPQEGLNVEAAGEPIRFMGETITKKGHKFAAMGQVFLSIYSAKQHIRNEKTASAPPLGRD